ncbi:hypothetical protein CVIRNUC_006521 [Coccomyxa viridis]|uniref:CHCH domain-containing protein n=1 Tax=Coccomyxa viridis TaxID=1274662 RepID=A0AAV1I9G3_9CHLO|nr:hypothetical protein CVIRNUC_006521 [Coccomyxa viridis]
MPRRSAGRSRPAPRPMSPPPRRPASTQAAPPPPANRSAAPPPAQSGGGGMLSGLGGMMAQGMALGTGSALAHRAVDSVLGSRHPEPAQAQAAAEEIAQRPEEPCSNFAKSFADCMSYNNGDMDSCRFYFDKLQACRVPEAAQQNGFAFQ